MKLVLIVCVVVAIVVETVYSATVVPIFFVWGQSNATKEVAQGVQNVVSAENPDARVVLSRHPGSALHFWARKGLPYIHLIDDFAVIDAVMSEIESEGNIPKLFSVIGMQGESDRFQTYGYYYDTMLTVGMLYQDRYGITFGEDASFILGKSAVNSTYTTEAAEDARLGLYTNINPAQEDAAAFFGGVAIETEHFPRGDFWHLTRPAAEDLGELLGQASLSYIPEPSTFCIVTPCLALLMWRRRNGASYPQTL